MEQLAEKEDPATEIGAGNPQEPERRSVRRRLVQSTLYPHKSPEIDSNGGQKADKNSGEDGEDEEDEEYCGSQDKKRRKQKGKATPQKRVYKKRSKEKQLVNTTPKKNVSIYGTISTNLMESEGASPPIPNLRLEAKLTAEENSRTFAGRQIHPFFSSWKVGKKYQETSEAESKWCSVERKDKSFNIGPIHVFERTQDEAVSLDWGNWTFYEEACMNTSCGLEGTSSSVYDGSAESLHIDKFTSVSHSPGVSLDQCLNQQENLQEASTTVSVVLVDEQVACCQLSKDSEGDHQVDEIDLLSSLADCMRNSDAEQQSGFLQERMMSYYLGCGSQPVDSLWTDKYQPKRAIEVCGNNESVKLMSEWLHLWHGRDVQAVKDLTGGYKCNMQDNDYNCYGSDSDSENRDEGASLKNVLLVTGPAGSGKSAAVYACAKEQGFMVLESNASECRNGAVVKQKFGEALESHSLKRSLENPVDPQSIHILKSTHAIPIGESAQVYDSEGIELITVPDDEEPHTAVGTSGKFVCRESGTVCDQVGVKSLILFEDVDITFPDDRGFVAAIQHIAEKAKRPIILTSNSNNPVLPDKLERLEVCFTMPSPKELLCHLYMICAAEKANIQPHLIERLIGCCHRDIRKAITYLQFWCQGKRYIEDRKVQKPYGPPLFDLDAGHQILPKVIPWDFPSRLSELVEQEITKSLSMMEENSTFMGIVEEEELDIEEMQNGLEMCDDETNSIEAKKEAMLSRISSFPDLNEFASPFDTASEVSNSFGTIVSFSRQNMRRKLVVMSSDSEDDLLNEGLPVVQDKDTNNELFFEDDSGFPSQCPNMQNCVSPLTDKQVHMKVEEFENNHYQGSKITNYLPMNDTCGSVDDISWVPELSFVPETEIDNGTDLLFRTVSCGRVAENIEVSVSKEFIQNLLPVETDNLDSSIVRLHKNSYTLGSACDAIAELSHPEEVEDSQNEHVKAVTRGHQVLDECSRMDFNRKSKPMEKLSSQVVTDLVQESWNKLRSCHTDLKQYVALEQKDAFRIVKLAHRMSSLISEADLLLSKCPILDSAEKSDVFSWCDELSQMTYEILQHGFCFHVKDIAAIGLNMGSESRLDLTREMLASPTNMMALGKLIGQDVRACRTSPAGRGLEMSPPESEILLKSEMKSCFFDIIKSVIPSRSYLALRGDAFHEYLSTLGCISRSEASRLGEGINKTKRRRGRVARHYLTSGALKLSPEDISLLGQYNLHGKISSHL